MDNIFLAPNTNYSFEIATANGFGEGKRTNPVYAQTYTIVNTSESSTNRAAIGGGVSGGIIVVIVLLVGLYLLRKRAQRRRQDVKASDLQFIYIFYFYI